MQAEAYILTKRDYEKFYNGDRIVALKKEDESLPYYRRINLCPSEIVEDIDENYFLLIKRY